MYTYIIIDDEPLIRRGTIKKLENYPNIDRKIKLPPEKYGKDWNDVVKSI